MSKNDIPNKWIKDRENYYRRGVRKVQKEEQISRDEMVEQDIVKIKKVMKALTELLEYKHRKYGGSALHPEGLFDVGGALTTIKVRMNDKFKRIQNSNGEPKVNDMSDLGGYDILYLVCMNENVDETIEQILAQKD